MQSAGFCFRILHTIYITGSAEINILNPFALSFGCSECSRVNRPKLFGVLAVLSAEGLTELAKTLSAIELTGQNSMEFLMF